MPNTKLTNAILPTGLVVTILIASISNIESKLSSPLGQNKSGSSSDVVDTLQSARNDTFTALSNLEGVAEGCCFVCIRGAADSLGIVDVQLRLALILIGETPGGTMIKDGPTQNSTTKQ